MPVPMLLLLLIAAPQPIVTVKQSGDGYRAEAPKFELADSQAIHDQIARRATELCTGKEVRWGKFGSLTELGREPGASPPKISGYFQEFRCEVPVQRTHHPAPANWKPTPADEADVRSVFDQYYAKRDAGDFEAATAMFQPGVRDKDGSAEELRAFNRKLGSGKRRVTAVTWYVNPTSAPVPGVYAALTSLASIQPCTSTAVMSCSIAMAQGRTISRGKNRISSSEATARPTQNKSR